jgi:hypothetical protein
LNRNSHLLKLCTLHDVCAPVYFIA